MKSSHKGIKPRSYYFISVPNNNIWFNLDTKEFEEYNPLMSYSSSQTVWYLRKAIKVVKRIMRQYKVDVTVAFQRGKEYKVFDFMYKEEK